MFVIQVDGAVILPRFYLKMVYLLDLTVNFKFNHAVHKRGQNALLCEYSPANLRILHVFRLMPVCSWFFTISCLTGAKHNDSRNILLPNHGPKLDRIETRKRALSSDKSAFVEGRWDITCINVSTFNLPFFCVFQRLWKRLKFIQNYSVVFIR
jgi:hypothetical protein